jgi:hypothetical protein
VCVKGDLGPAQVFQILAVGQLPLQVAGRGCDARVVVSLQGQEHQGRRAGDGLGGPAQDAAVAVVDAALVVGPVQQQPQPLLDARVSALAGAAQGQAGPGGRLGPGEVALGPGPADQLQVDVVQVLGGVVVGAPPSQREQPGRGALNFRDRRAERRLNEQHKGSRPDGLLAAAGQAVAAVRGGTALEGLAGPARWGRGSGRPPATGPTGPGMSAPGGRVGRGCSPSHPPDALALPGFPEGE